MHTRPRYSTTAPGFSLLEMLAVIAIMAIAIALSIPAFNSVGKSQRLTAAITSTDEALQNARRRAVTSNRVVEFRVRESPETGEFNGFYTVMFDEFRTTSSAVDRTTFLPGGFVFEPSKSTLLSELPEQTSPAPTPFRYHAIRFLPDGSSDLDESRAWYLTVIHENVRSQPDSPDVASLTIDPSTGSTTIFRP